MKLVYDNGYASRDELIKDAEISCAAVKIWLIKGFLEFRTIYALSHPDCGIYNKPSILSLSKSTASK